MQNRGFSVDWLGELKRKNDLVSVASAYLKLYQKGRRFWACCPFHNEKTPSFSINNEDGVYFCYGCKEYGDVIKFVQKMENLDFLDAVQVLADRAGMQIPEFQSKTNSGANKHQKERVLSVLDFAYKHYMENLYNKDAKLAQDYIKQRKFTRKELEDFKIGYSKSWTDIVDYLKNKGFSDQEILDAGVCIKKNGELIDVFRHRLIFPVFNALGECLGFSARALQPTDFGKYVNTSETVVFKKRRIVYGINFLRTLQHQQLLKNIILVEGQMDVIAMHKGGFMSAVACMGTAITEDHVHELKKYSKNIILCFDGDTAGIKATLKAIDLWRNEEVSLKVVSLPDGKDPDEILKLYGKEKLQDMIEESKPYMDFLIDYYCSKYNLEKAEEKGKFVKEILSEIKKLGSATMFEPYLEKIRDITNIPLDVLRRDINFEETAKPFAEQKSQVVLPKTETIEEKAIKFVLASILHRRDVVDQKLDYKRLLAGFEKYLEIINKNLPLSSIFDIEGLEHDDLLIELVNFNFAVFEKDEEKYFKECITKLVEHHLKKMQAELNEEYKNCEDLNRRVEIARKLGAIALQLKNKSLEEFYVRR